MVAIMKRFLTTVHLTVLTCSFCVGILSPCIRLSKGETIFEDTEVSFLATKNGETIGEAKGRFSGWTSNIISGFQHMGIEETLNYMMKEHGEEVIPISIEKLEILAPDSNRVTSTFTQNNVKVKKERDKYCL